MSNQQDPLQAIWQQQQIEVPDIAALRRKWHRMRLKQWLYFVLDMLMLVFVLGLMVYVYPRMTTFGAVLIILMSAGVAGVTFYVAWLRRHALGLYQANTGDYLDKLALQIKSNIRIAELSIKSLLPSSVIVMIFHVGNAYFKNGLSWQSMEKAMVAAMLLAIIMPLIGIWAKRRRHKYMRELDKLNAYRQQ